VPAWIKEKDEGIQRLGEIIDHLKDQSRAFRARWDMFRLVFGHDLPGFGKPSPNYDWDSTQKRAGLRTLAGEVVKSSEECVIANWLFYNGVDYVYERAYEFDTATSRHSQYHPDFYYPQIKLYHEHFALDKKGNPPADFEGYMDGVLWKRGEHRRRGTDFIETASYQLWSGKLFKNLSKELTSRGIELDPNPDRTLPENGKAPLEECALIELVRSFICHAKSNCLSSEDLKNRSKNMPADSFRVRHSMFLALIEPIRDAWEAALLAEKGIDFEDMLNQAAEHIEQGRYQSKYELVLADEFQDSSWARARLCLALVNNPNRHLFAVGDDWQSINRFAGADVSVMTGFHDWCGQGQILKLEQTFRCPQALCDVSGHFVSKNPKQLTKQVRSVTPSYGPVLQAFQLPQKDQVSGAVLEYLKDLHQGVVSGKIPVGRNGKISVFILGRYRQDGKYLPRSWRHEFGDLLDVKFLTMHTSKGAEADYVVLPGMVQRGFPNLRREDPVLSLAMPGCDTFLLAEERRLFYVALTRARRSVAMFTVKGQTSPFLDELVNDGFVTITDTEGKAIEEQRCPVCKRGVLIERSGKYGPFLGCSSYPECRYTLDLGKGKQPPTRNLAHG
jgi:DNA helicase-4